MYKKELEAELNSLSWIASQLEIPYDKELDYLFSCLKKDSSFYMEKQIELYANKLRNIWLQNKTTEVTDRFKSPYVLNNLYRELNYSYERNLDTLYLERKLDSTNTTLLFKSGISAIFTSVSAAFSIMNVSNYKYNVLFQGSYFENKTIFDLYKNFNIKIDFEFNDNDYDIIFFEPKKYNWNLDSIELERLLSVIDNDRVQVIIMDITLTIEPKVYSIIIEHMEKTKNKILFEVKSKLKLDQYGLEFTNLGSLKVSTFNIEGIHASSILEYLRDIRTVQNGGLDIYTSSIINNNIFFNHEQISKYTDQVISNNNYFRKSIPNSCWFHNISSMDTRSPFIVFETKNRDMNINNAIMKVIGNTSEKYDASIYYGSSFGFRHHRFETIIPDKNKNEGYFKIAIGYRKGPSLDLMISIFEKGFDSICLP